MVYVISKDGQPLMPTTRYGKVRRLLKSKQAKVINRCPFTIKLLYETTSFVQETNLGVDTGSKHVGFAVYSEGKILYQSQLELRDDIKSKMDDRRGHRRFRRQRKTRYRKPRFLNRKNSTKLNRLPPSIKSKIYLGKIYFIKGRRSAGTCALMDIFNNPVYFNHMPKGCKIPKLANCKRVSSRKSVIIERRIGAIPVLS